jgi:hypothetical protein
MEIGVGLGPRANRSFRLSPNLWRRPARTTSIGSEMSQTLGGAPHGKTLADGTRKAQVVAYARRFVAPLTRFALMET